MSPEINPRHTVSTMMTAEAAGLLNLGELDRSAHQIDMLTPKNPAFAWLHDGHRATRTNSEAHGTGIEYRYPIFSDRPLVSGNPEYCASLGAKTRGYYEDDNPHDRYEWRCDLDLTDVDHSQDVTNQSTTSEGKPMRWYEADYNHWRTCIAQEERYRLMAHFFRPPKDTAEIVARQATFAKLSNLSELDALIDLKNGSYEALVGLRQLFAVDDQEGSLYDHHCAGDERSPIMGDYWDKIGEYDVLASIDECANLINHGFDAIVALIEQIRSSGLETNAYQLPTTETIQQFRSMIDQIIALDGSRRVTKLESSGSWGARADEVTYKLLGTVENMFLAIGMPLEIARIIRDEGWAPASFNPEEPTSYEGGWNIARNKRQQTTIDSPNGATPLVIISGPNTSGKSMTMDTDMLIRLAAQTTGFVPAERANIQPSDAFIKLERAGSFERNDLSAYMGEIAMWNDAFEVFNQASRACVYADESFSTTSPEEQAELQLETAKYLMRKFGARVIIATHNGMVLDRAATLDPHTVGVCHPDAYIDEKGIFRRNFKLLPGPGDSMSFVVARAHAFPNDTLAMAEAYYNGIISQIPEVVATRFIPILDYTPEQRAKLMQEQVDLDGLFSDGSDSVFRVYSAQGNKFSFKFDSPVDGELRIGEGIELSMANFLALRQPAHADNINFLINKVQACSPAEVLERQRLFASLIADKTYDSLARSIPKLITLDFAIKELTAAAGTHFESINPLARYEMCKPSSIDKSPSKGVYMQELLAAFAAADAYIQLHEATFSDIDHSTLRKRLSEYEMKALTEAGKNTVADNVPAKDTVSATEAVPDWERTLIEEWSDEQASFNKFLMTLGIPEMKTASPEQLLAILHNNEAQSGKDGNNPFLKLSETTITGLQNIIKTVGDIPFTGADGRFATFDLLDKMAPDSVFQPIEHFKKFHVDGAPTTVTGQLNTYRATQDSLSAVLNDLRKADSVQLRQFANTLEQHYKESFESLRQGEIKQTSLEILDTKKRKTPKEIFNTLQMSLEQPWATKQLSKLHTLCYVAGSLDTQNYTPVVFNATGEVRLEDAFNPGTIGRKDIVRNPVHLDGNRVIALTGPNGSGKTFYLDVASAATVIAHAVGYAPASAATMPIFQHVIYIDRVTKHDENLSSFAQDIENWKKVYETLGKAEGPVFVGADEPFTTTSERYQEALIHAVITDFFKKDNRYLATSTHNHAAVNQLGPLITPYHFGFEIDALGHLDRDFHLLPGHAPSHAAAMARTLGFPEEILKSMP